MTKQLRTQIDIQASPERVWQVLTDFGAYSQWNPFMVQASGRAAQGERITIRMRPEGGRAMTFRPTVREATARRRLSWLGHLVLPGLFDGEHSFTIEPLGEGRDRKSTRLNSSHVRISYAVFCLKKKKKHKYNASYKKKKNKKY